MRRETADLLYILTIVLTICYLAFLTGCVSVDIRPHYHNGQMVSINRGIYAGCEGEIYNVITYQNNYPCLKTKYIMFVQPIGSIVDICEEEIE